MKDKFTTNSLFELDAHDDEKHETVSQAGKPLEWVSRGILSFTRVRFRHINSAKLMQISMCEGKKKASLKRKKMQYTMTLGENQSAEEVNSKLN
jgi:hypothetical protein